MNCRLTVSKELGDLIYNHCMIRGQGSSSPAVYVDELLSLAHDVYSDCGAHVEAMACLVKRGRVSDVMQYVCFTDQRSCTPQHLVDVIRTTHTVTFRCLRDMAT